MTGPEAAALPLHEWEGFYVIVGTSAAALTGLMFVVIAIVADAGPRAATPRGIATFLTPTIVHFCMALLISADSQRALAETPGSADHPGAGRNRRLHLHAGSSASRVRRDRTTPRCSKTGSGTSCCRLFAYALTLGASLWLESMTPLALLLVGGASVLLLLIGIHNAWDTVEYLILQRMQREQEKTENNPPPTV